jgi:peptidoglycan hydrolase-like protein with peptidoglycan-binding domain
MARTGADKLREWALSFDGLDDYQWGEVPGPYGDKDKDPRDGDCSGACYAWWRYGGVPAKVLGGRQTAEAYSRRARTIDSDDLVCGDCIVLLNNDGQAHHIIMCIGNGETMEAKGEKYGYVRSTVAKCMKRGNARAKRMPDVWSYLGDLSSAKSRGAPRPKHPPWPNLYFHVGMKDKGEKGAIRMFQRKLKDRGWDIDVDGEFGPATEKVVKKFQRQKSLEVDGEVGPMTWNAIWSSPVTND